MDERIIQVFYNLRQTLERLATSLQQLDRSLARLDEIHGLADNSAASSSTTRAVPETLRNILPETFRNDLSETLRNRLSDPLMDSLSNLPEPLSNSIMQLIWNNSRLERLMITLIRHNVELNSHEEVQTATEQDTFMSGVSAASALISEALPDMQRNAHRRLGSRINVQDPTPVTTQDRVTNDASVQPSLTTSTVQGTQRTQKRRKRSLRYSYRKRTRPAANTIAQDPSTSGESSLTVPAVPQMQTKRKRRKRSLRYSFAKNTKKATAPAIAQDQVTSTDSLPPVVDTPGEYICTICLDTADSTEIKSLECSHMFHQICIDAWLIQNETCPVCREVTMLFPHGQPPRSEAVRDITSIFLGNSSISNLNI